jgi:hypothetical protein
MARSSDKAMPRPGTGSGDGAVEDAEEPDDESHHGLRVKARVLLSCWRHSNAHPAVRNLRLARLIDLCETIDIL